MNKEHNICKSPFFYIEVFVDGTVNCCCPSYIKFPIGNIYENKIEDIWNSKNAQKIRQLILKNNYSCCNADLCSINSNPAVKELEYINTNEKLKKEMPLPKLVKFCHDYECNLKCITCRKDIMCHSKEELEKLNNNIEKYYLPLLKNAETVCMNGSGDCLASRHSRILIKKIIEKYPKIKFDIHTNGLLCNEKVLKELDLINRISVIEISLHASTQNTYEKIVLGSNWEKVIKNIKWVSELKKTKKIDDLFLFFVVNSINYNEIIDFANLAQTYNAETYFWNYRNWGTQTKEEEKALAITEKGHKDNNILIKILQNNVLKNEHCHLNPLLMKLSKSTKRNKFFENLLKNFR